MSLFQTRAWQSAWWETWGCHPGFHLVRPWDGQVSGLYRSSYRWKGLLPIKSLQFVGTSSRELKTPRTEYNRFFATEMGADIDQAIDDLLHSDHWTEAVFNDLRRDSTELLALERLASRRSWGFRETASDDGYAVTTRGAFDDYLASLGSGTRLRLYNRRTVLDSLGEVREENLWPTGQARFFRLLNDYHRARWNKDCLTGPSLAFHQRFLSRIEEEGGNPLLSLLSCGDRCISVLYNVQYQGVVYNIQAGFEEKFHKKLSLGSLHLGYAIEQAFEAPDTHRFDMLAGEGQNEDYKVRIATDAYQFVSVMLVRHPVFQLLYRLKG